MQPTMLTFLSKPKAKPTKPGEEERKLRLRVTSAFSGWPIMVRIHHRSSFPPSIIIPCPSTNPPTNNPSIHSLSPHPPYNIHTPQTYTYTYTYTYIHTVLYPSAPILDRSNNNQNQEYGFMIPVLSCPLLHIKRTHQTEPYRKKSFN